MGSRDRNMVLTALVGQFRLLCDINGGNFSRKHSELNSQPSCVEKKALKGILYSSNVADEVFPRNNFDSQRLTILY